jgi:tetratricopeptide (TPR) repeat protein
VSRIDKLKDFLAADPADSFTRYAIALEYGKDENFPKAIAALEELREFDPDYVPLYYMLAGYYREMGDLANAEAIYHEGIKKAQAANDLHAMSELQSALDEL